MDNFVRLGGSKSEDGAARCGLLPMCSKLTPTPESCQEWPWVQFTNTILRDVLIQGGIKLLLPGLGLQMDLVLSDVNLWMEERHTVSPCCLWILSSRSNPPVTARVTRVHHVCDTISRPLHTSSIKTPQVAKHQRKHGDQYQIPKNDQDGGRHRHIQYTSHKESGGGWFSRRSRIPLIHRSFFI